MIWYAQFQSDKGTEETAQGIASTVVDCLTDAKRACLSFADYHTNADNWTNIVITIERQS